MNWLSILILAIPVVYIFSGVQKGMIRTAFSFVSVILTLILSFALNSQITGILRNHTPIYDMIQENCEESIVQDTEGKLAQEGDSQKQNQFIQQLPVPDSVKNILIENNGIYSYINSFQVKSNIKRENKNLHCMFQHHSREKIDLLIRVFCLDIPTHKASCLADLSINCIADFYAEFRKLIYERQYKTLLGYFFQKGQIGRHRIFFKQYAYFYVYNNQVFVSEKFLQETNGKCFTKAEVQELKKMYSYLARKVAHKSNQIKLHQKLAEGIWRKNKDFIELYQDLKVNLLNIS